MAVIAIDLDHTLVEGATPLPGAKEAINILREAGHRIVIHSCNNLTWIKSVLENADIRYDWIWGESQDSGKKPLADLYIDDKGYHFQGDWNGELPAILERVAKFDNRKYPGVSL